jgi:hypothetical protein
MTQTTEQRADTIMGLIGMMVPKMTADDVYAFAQVVGVMSVKVPDVDVARCYHSLNYGRDKERGE